jgi:RNA polymerase sigma-70 factor (ECF subfamily)
MRHYDDDIDRALEGWRQGDRGAGDELFRLVYDELRILAARQLRRRRPGDTLGPTVLVYEVYLRLAQRSSPNLVDRNHFVALATSAMRKVIVD